MNKKDWVLGEAELKEKREGPEMLNKTGPPRGCGGLKGERYGGGGRPEGSKKPARASLCVWGWERGAADGRA